MLIKGLTNEKLFSFTEENIHENNNIEIDNLNACRYISNYNKVSNNINIICTCPNSIDKNVWIYEHIRLLIIELGWLTSILMDYCTNKSCPVMRATEKWEYLCAGTFSMILLYNTINENIKNFKGINSHKNVMH